MLKLANVHKIYRRGEAQIQGLRDISLSVNAHDFITITGPSGCGKSTLLNIMGLIDRPDAGDYELDGQSMLSVSARKLAKLRLTYFGYVFQNYHLVPSMTALENVAAPLGYAGVPKGARTSRARAMLERVGLQDRMDNRPGQLSGGQQQRVAIARALINRPKVILADEPTGNLDSSSGQQIIQLLQSAYNEGACLIIATHDSALASMGKAIVRMKDARIVSCEAARGSV